MDKNTIVGLLLMALVLIVNRTHLHVMFSWRRLFRRPKQPKSPKN